MSSMDEKMKEFRKLLEIMDRLAMDAADEAVNAGYPQGAKAMLIVELEGTAEEVEANVKARVQTFSENASVETKLGTDAVATSVSMPVTDIAIIGFMGQLMKFDITVSSMHLVES